MIWRSNVIEKKLLTPIFQVFLMGDVRKEVCIQLPNHKSEN